MKGRGRAGGSCKLDKRCASFLPAKEREETTGQLTRQTDLRELKPTNNFGGIRVRDKRERRERDKREWERENQMHRAHTIGRRGTPT